MLSAQQQPERRAACFCSLSHIHQYNSMRMASKILATWRVAVGRSSSPSPLWLALLLALAATKHAASTTAVSPAAARGGAAAAARPNVLTLLIDDMGYGDLPAYGAPNVSTPHIDALVASGMRFTQWISAASICTPSRAALQTGRYPIRTGCVGNVEQYRVIPTPANPHGLDPSSQVSLATVMRRAGYATGM